MVDSIKVGSSVKEIYKQLSSLPVLQMVELVKMCQEEWDLLPSSSHSDHSAAPAPVLASPAATEEAKTSFAVVLKSCDATKKLKLVMAMRKVRSDMDIAQAKELIDRVIDGAEEVIKDAVVKEEAQDIKAKMEAEGATIELR